MSCRFDVFYNGSFCEGVEEREGDRERKKRGGKQSFFFGVNEVKKREGKKTVTDEEKKRHAACARFFLFGTYLSHTSSGSSPS